MNREAAALGVPVYSIFRGKSGAVDRQLQNEGRLVLIENIDDVNNKILLQRRSKEAIPTGLNPRKALSMIIDHIDIDNDERVCPLKLNIGHSNLEVNHEQKT